MADNGTAASGPTIGWDDIGGVAIQRVKPAWGVDGSMVDTSATNPLPVTVPPNTASGSITTQNLVPAGTATAGSAVELTVDDSSSGAIQVTGTYTGALSVQATVDGAVWVTFSGVPLVNINTGVSSATIPSAATGIYQMDCSAFLKVRVTALAAVTGTAVVTMIGSAGTGAVALDTMIPAGSNDIGGVIVREPKFWFEIDVPGVANDAHAVGEQIGTIISITNAARANDGTGHIESILYYDNDDVLGAVDFFFFESTVSLAGDSAAFAISDADARELVAPPIKMTYLEDLGAQRVGGLVGMKIDYRCVGGTTLFLSMRVQGASATFTGGATGQHIKICLVRD